MFTVNGHNFDSRFAFPPMDEKNIQNAVMVAPINEHSRQMFVWGWNCSVQQDGTEVWGWEPMYPYGEDVLVDFLTLIKGIREDLAK